MEYTLVADSVQVSHIKTVDHYGSHVFSVFSPHKFYLELLATTTSQLILYIFGLTLEKCCRVAENQD